MQAQPPQENRLAYVVSRFPDYSEGFVRYEMCEIQRHVGPLLVFPLVRRLNDPGDLLAEAGIRPENVFPHPPDGPASSVRGSRPGLTDIATELVRALARAPSHGLKWAALLRRAFRIGRCARALGIRHIHAHFAALPAAAAWTVNRAYGIPYSFTAHAYDLRLPACVLAPRVRDAAFAVVVSESTARTVRAFSLPRRDPWRVIRNGVPLDRFAPVPRMPGPEGLRILSVGRLVAQKGFEILLDACRQLIQRGVRFRCSIAGDGPLRRRLLSRIRANGMQHYVRLQGILIGRELTDAYRHADLFVLPCVVSDRGDADVLPVVLTEAMATGLPVIATPVGAIPELIRDGWNGRLVPRGQPDRLAEAVAQLDADPETRRTLGRRARAFVEQEYDVQSTAASLARLLHYGALREDRRR